MRKLIERLLRVMEDKADDMLQPHSPDKVQAMHKKLFGEAFNEDAKQRALRMMMEDDFFEQLFQAALGSGDEYAFRDTFEDIIQKSIGRFSDAMEQDVDYDDMRDTIADEQYKFEDRVIESYLALIKKQVHKIRDFGTGELF